MDAVQPVILNAGVNVRMTVVADAERHVREPARRTALVHVKMDVKVHV